jgi:hypothetical protein
MSELTELQEWMVRLLRSERSLGKLPNVADESAARIEGNDRLKPVERLEIYREQFWLRHTASLVEDFPGLGGVIGQRSWEKLVEGYLTEYPPDSWTLRDLGDRLPDYVARAADVPHRELCIDMARLEWAYIEIFDAPEVPAIDAAKLALVPEEAWEHAVIVLNPALRLLEVSYPVAELRRALRQKGDEAVPVPVRAPQRLAVYRAANRGLYHKAVSEPAFRLLVALGEGVPLVPACERVASELSEPTDLENQIGAWFGQWGRLGWIADVIA